MANFIPDWLRVRAELSSESLALTDGHESWTFQQLHQVTGRIATRLARRGISHGSRVALAMPGHMKVVPLIHAVSRLGAVLVPLNPRLRPDELAALVDDAAVDALIGDGGGPHSERTLLLDDLFLNLDTEPEHPGSAINPEAIQFLVYTSGTTGRPKGALLSYGNTYASAVSSAIHMGTGPEDLWLHMMPVFHIGGLSILFRSVITGSGIVWLPQFDPAAVFRLLREYPVTLMSVVPTMLYRLLRHNEAFPPTLRLVLLGGAPAPSSLIEEARIRNVPAVQTYGLTETGSQIATRLPSDQHGSPSSGHAIYPTEIAVLGPQGPTQDAGVQGEILVKGPTVFQGYWRQPERTAETFWHDWLKTGDIGYLDGRGYLTVVDREKDLIIKGGENLSPTEIEVTLMAHPHVVDAGVVGVVDAEWGQVPAAIVAVDQPISVEELRQWTATRLSTLKHPSHYYQADALPRTASGKLRRRELVSQLAAGFYRPIS